ncbi:MAG: NADH-quinone oxidoreductase subunit K [Candidatus Micrarchaeia archaeon]
MFVFYFVIMAIVLFSAGLASIIATKHFFLMLVGAELALTGSALAALSMFSMLDSGNILLMLFLIWSIAASEAIALITFYRYIVKYENNFDVSKLNKLSDK